MKRVQKFLHHLFVPSERNNYRARSIHHDSLFAYLLIALILVTVSRVHMPGGQVLSFATDITTQQLVDLTNQQRSQYHLSPLAFNSTLSQAAGLKAQDMFAKGYWAHFAPDGTSPWDFFREVGYDYEYAGENLAKNFLYSKDVVAAWMASPGHRENLLRPEYTDVGFAVVNGVLNGEETTLVVQLFGKPLGTAVPAAHAQEPKPQQTLTQTAPTNAPEHVPLVQTLPATSVTARAKIPFNLTMGAIILLGTIFLVDFYYASRLGVFRMSGKNLAHFIFLVFVAGGLIFFISRGAIL